MMWLHVRGAQRVMTGKAVTTSTLKVQSGSGYWNHRSLQSPTPNLVSVLTLETNIFLRGRSEDPTALFLSSDASVCPEGAVQTPWLAPPGSSASRPRQGPLGSSLIRGSRAVILGSANWNAIFNQPRRTCPSSPYIVPNPPEWSHSLPSASKFMTPVSLMSAKTVNVKEGLSLGRDRGTGPTRHVFSVLLLDFFHITMWSHPKGPISSFCDQKVKII